MVQEELRDQIREMIALRDIRNLREVLLKQSVHDIPELIGSASAYDKAVILRILPPDFAIQIFQYFDRETQKKLYEALGDSRYALLLDEMAPDDRTQLLVEFEPEIADHLLSLLSSKERKIATQLLEYPEGSVGRLMSPDYIIVGKDWPVPKVLEHIRHYGRDSETLNVVYVVDEQGRLIDDIRSREILLAPPNWDVEDLLSQSFVALKVDQSQESAVEMFRKYDRTALPVIDAEGKLRGTVTVDDVLDVAAEQATEDIQKLGGVEALSEPYLRTPLGKLIRKRAGWLVVLFIGELLTASAMAIFEGEISKAVVLALFVPLIISSGGNSGSQACALIIRALALGELTSRDWAVVLKREIVSGLALGLILGAIGMVRILVWSAFVDLYGPHYLQVSYVVFLSLIAVVMWGTCTGAMLPLLLTRLRIDPATSSTPFVATLVDVTGLVIYFSIAAWILRGLLL